MRSKKTVIPEEVNFQFYHEKLSMVQAKLDGHRRERTGLLDRLSREFRQRMGHRLGIIVSV